MVASNPLPITQSTPPPGGYCRSRYPMSSARVYPATCSIARSAGMCLPRWPITAASSSSTSGNVAAELRTSDSLGPTRLLKYRQNANGRGGVGFPCSARWLFEFWARQ